MHLILENLRLSNHQFPNLTFSNSRLFIVAQFMACPLAGVNRYVHAFVQSWDGTGTIPYKLSTDSLFA